MKRYILPILAIILAIGCYVLASRSEHERLEILELRASAEAGNQREIKERTEIEHLRVEVADFQKASLLGVSKTGGPSVAEGQGANGPASIDLTPFMMKDPAYARVHRESALNMLKRLYGDLKALNLPPDQLQKLTDLLVDRYTTQNDAQEASTQAGLKFGSPEYTKAVGDATLDDDNQIKSLLGASGYQQLQDVAALNKARLQLQFSVVLPLNAGGTPISNDQLTALAGIQMKLQSSPEETRNADFSTLAAQVMTPEQYATYSQNATAGKDYNDLVQRALAAAKQQYGNENSWHISGQ